MKNYSFVNTTLHINGVEITGWRETDDLINVAREEDSATHIVSAKGEMIVSLIASRAGGFTFNLDQTSDSNVYLSGLMALQENAAFVPISIQMKDLDGKAIASGTQGYLTKPADMVRGKKTNTATWQINVERADMINT